MPRRAHHVRAFLCALAAAPAVFAAAAQESFDLRVPSAPMVRTVDAGRELVYELHLDNYARSDLDPVSIDVLDAATGTVLQRYDGDALQQRLDRSGLQWNASTFAAIPSGRRGIVFIELTLPDTLPARLRHPVGYVATPGDTVLRIEGGDTAVITDATRVLAPPLSGGPWVAIHDAFWERGHRRVGYAVDGRLRTPGRHAADWVKLDADGRKAPDDSTRAADTYSHGEAVLAVADGVVHDVHDSTPERVRLSDELVEREGNHVVLALDGGGYAHYGHLRPGSAVVASGARVKAGDRLAEVGFSGSASDPQLHFALTDGPDEMASEGLAYTFDGYRLLGRFDDVAEIGTTRWTPVAGDAERRATMPGGMSVLEWNR